MKVFVLLVGLIVFSFDSLAAGSSRTPSQVQSKKSKKPVKSNRAKCLDKAAEHVRKYIVALNKERGHAYYNVEHNTDSADTETNMLFYIADAGNEVCFYDVNVPVKSKNRGEKCDLGTPEIDLASANCPE